MSCLHELLDRVVELCVLVVALCSRVCVQICRCFTCAGFRYYRRAMHITQLRQHSSSHDAFLDLTSFHFHQLSGFYLFVC
jgi:hypothetical protein